MKAICNVGENAAREFVGLLDERYADDAMMLIAGACAGFAHTMRHVALERLGDEGRIAFDRGFSHYVSRMPELFDAPPHKRNEIQ